MREGPKALADLPDLVHPVSQHLFMGVVSRDQLPLVSRLMGGTGDFCDWPQIEAWADDIAAHLRRDGRPFR